jgi:hypothetical protein
MIMTDIEWSVRVERDNIDPQGIMIERTADEDCCERLAKRFGVLKVEGLQLTARLSLMGKRGVFAVGQIRGRVQQTCSVSLESVWTDVVSDFDVEFQPSDIVAKYVVDEDDFETDIPEALIEGEAEIGECAVQFFALEIPLYPRRPDAVLDIGSAEAVTVNEEFVEEKAPSPFMALKDLDVNKD